MSKQNKKAIIHLFEAIIASMLLAGYFFFVYSSYDESIIEKQMYFEPELKSKIFDFLSNFKNTDATAYFIEQGQNNQLNALLKYFFGKDLAFGLSTIGLPKNKITIGVVSKRQFFASTDFCPSCNFTSHWDYNAYNLSFIKNISVVNISGNKINALYIDANNDGNFSDSISEGPFLQGTIINISNYYWTFVINNSLTKPRILFIDATDAIKLKKKLNLHIANKSNPFYMNEREIIFDIKSVSLNQSFEELTDNDILFFYNYRNLDTYEQKLEDLVDEKITLFEIINYTWSNDNVQTKIFNLKRTPDTTGIKHRMGNNTNVDLNINFVDMSVKEFFNENIITLKTKRYYSSLNYTSDEDNELNKSLYDKSAFATTLFVGNISYPIAITKDAAGEYRNLYITNKTQNTKINFTGLPFNKIHNTGDLINITPFDYEILDIDSKGRFVKLKNKNKKYKFPDKSYEMTYLYVQPRIIDIDEKYILFKQNRFYNLTNHSIGDIISNSSAFNDLSSVAESRGIRNCFDPIKNTSINLSSTIELEVAVANCSKLISGIDSFFIDLPPINPNTGKFNLTLIKRWQIPVAIINHIEKKGSTVFMVNPINSSDAWAIVKSALASFSNKEEKIILQNPSRKNSVFDEHIFFTKGNINIPYLVRLGIWYF